MSSNSNATPQHAHLTAMMINADIWVDHIFAFVGIGHFAFVANVCRSFRDHYKKSVQRQKAPLVKFFRCKCLMHGPEGCRHDELPARISDTFFSAVFANVTCAEFWRSEKSKKDRFLVIPRVATVGNLDVLRWALRKGFPWDPYAFCLMASNGHLDALKWACYKGCDWHQETCASAAANGQLETLKWVRKRGCPWSIRTSHNAAEHGHLETLKWAHEHGCPWDAGTCYRAARNGHLEVLKYAHENGCPGTGHPFICSGAAKGGHLEILKWARENGCSWDAGTCMNAKINGHLELLKWAQENGCPPCY